MTVTSNHNRTSRSSSDRGTATATAATATATETSIQGQMGQLSSLTRSRHHRRSTIGEEDASASVSSSAQVHDHDYDHNDNHNDGKCILDIDALISDDENEDDDDDLSIGTDDAIDVKLYSYIEKQNGEYDSDDDEDYDENNDNDGDDNDNNDKDENKENDKEDDGEEKEEEASEEASEEALEESSAEAARTTTTTTTTTTMKPKPKPRNVPDSRMFKWVASKEWKQAEDFLSDDDITKQEKQKALLYRDESDGGLGNTPLVRAILKQSAPLSLLKLMIKIGGIESVQMVNDSNWSVLHWVAFSNHVPLNVFQLVVQKANSMELFEAKNNYNQTPLDILLSKGGTSSTSASAAMDKIEVMVAKQQRLLKYQHDLLMSSSATEATAEAVTTADTPTPTTPTPPLPSSASTMALSSSPQSQKKAALKKTIAFYSSCINGIISWSRNLPESEQSLVLKHSYFKSMLNHAFISPQYLFVAMMDFYLQFAIVLVFSFFLRIAIEIAVTSTSTSTSTSTEADITAPYVITSTIILIFGFIWFFIRKTTQLMSSLLKTFFLDPINVLDMIQLVLLVGSIVLIIGGNDSSATSSSSSWVPLLLNLSTMDRLVFTSACCVTWLKLIFVIGNLYYVVGVFASTFITIFGKVIPFLFISTILTFMLSHMYLMWSVGQSEICDYASFETVSIGNEDNWTCNASSSYAETFAMLFSLDSQSSPHSDSSGGPNVISFIHGFIISILMLNILIAIVSYHFQMALEKGEHTFWKNRLQFITECQSFFSLFAFLEICHGNCRREIGRYDDHNDDYSRVEIDDDLQSTFINEHDNVSHFDRGEDVESICTTKSRSVLVPVNRIAFGKRINLDVYRRRLAKNDKKIFFRWWFNKSNHPVSTPPLKTRLQYFFRRASIHEIIFPGKEFENVLIGIKYNEKGKGSKLFFARLASYLLSVVNIFLVFMALILGSISFGLLWPSKMKENLFYVDTKSRNATDERIVEVEVFKVEMMNKFQEYEQNQEKKLERLMKNKEEKEKKRLAKVFHKQKDFSKKQKEHERRFDKIDQDLDEIKSMINAIGTKLKG